MFLRNRDFFCREQDEFAMRSHTLAKAATDAGKLKDVVPVFLDGKKPQTVKVLLLRFMIYRSWGFCLLSYSVTIRRLIMEFESRLQRRWLQ